jgi:lysyl-tRNA synthetase class 1
MLESQLRRSVADVPDPFGEAPSYAAHHIEAFERSLAPLCIAPEFIRQSRRYRAGDYAGGIVQALERRAAIRRILDQHRSQPLHEGWLPLAGFCAGCGRDEVDFEWNGDGRSDEDDLRWQVGMHCRSCGHEAIVDLRKGGDVKLPWRVDWPMRWAYEGVHFEPGGKDHSSAGGSYDTAREIVAEVYGGRAPEYVAYDFVRIKGRGGKISSSKGEAVTVADCLEIYEPDMLRWIFASVRPGSEFQISFDLDVIKLYEDYDRARRLAYEAEDGGKNDKKRQVARRTFELARGGGERIEPGSEPPFVPPFRGLTMILQIHDGDIEASRAHYVQSGEIRNDEERRLHDERAGCAWRWILQHAPEDFRYRIREEPVALALTGDDRIVIERLV